MKLRIYKKTSGGFTLTDLFLVIIILAILLACVDFPATHRAKEIALRINCLNNLKQLGYAYRIWSDDHGGFPMNVSTNIGGTMEFFENPDDIWRSYEVMSNELSIPKILYCPSDEKRWPPATNFSSNLKGKVSYFIGLKAATNLPNAFLSGDESFSILNKPVLSGLVQITSGTSVAWTKEGHGLVGNIGFVDGSVKTPRNPEFIRAINDTGLKTNLVAIP